MPFLQNFAGLSSQLVGQGTASLAALGLLVGLIGIAAASRHLFAFLAASLLALLGCLTALLPNATPSLVAVAASLGSVLVSIAGIHLRRRQVRLRRRLERLERAIDQMEHLQSMHLMQAIKSETHPLQTESSPANHKAPPVASLD
jgi:hypothetical protein